MQPLSKTKLKLFSSLHLKKYREEHKLFVIEGRKMLGEALIQGIKPEAILFCNLPGTVQIPGIEKSVVHTVSEAEFSRLTGQVNPDGVLAVLPWPDSSHLKFISKTDPLPALPSTPGFILEDIRDPGNLGTLLRICDWFGFNEVFCSETTADCLNLKVLRSSMGSFFRVKITYISAFNEFVSANAERIWAADMEGTEAGAAKFDTRKWILLGNEANGLSGEIKSIKGLDFISIPGKGNAESLNVAVAGGILAFLAGAGQK